MTWRLPPNNFFPIDIRFKNAGPVLTMINDWYRIAADGLGVRTSFIHLLEERLIAAGFDQVQVSDYDIPIGEWSDDPGNAAIEGNNHH
jgi:hypothetical protein